MRSFFLGWVRFSKFMACVSSSQRRWSVAVRVLGQIRSGQVALSGWVREGQNYRVYEGGHHYYLGSEGVK